MEKQINILIYNHKYFDDLAELGFCFLKLHNQFKAKNMTDFKKIWLPYIKQIKDLDTYLIIVALQVKTNRLVGYAIARQASDDSTLYGNLDSIILDEIFVADEYRGQRVGEALIKNVEEWGKSKNRKYIILKVRASNYNGVNFYKKMNYHLYNYVFRKSLTDG